MSLRLKLSLMFLAIAVIPLVIVDSIIFHNYKDSMEASHVAALRDVAVYKAEKIESFFESLKKFMMVSQELYVIKKNLPVLCAYASRPESPECRSAVEQVDSVMRELQAAVGLVDAMLVTPEGRIIYSSNQEHKFRDFGKMLPGFLVETYDPVARGIRFSDIFMNRMNRNRPGMLVTGPVFDSGRNFVGDVVFEADIESIYRLIMDQTGLGETGGTLLVKQDAGKVVFLNPLRFDPGAAFKKTVKVGDKIGIPAQEAARDRKGAGRSIDYRGMDVIAAWRGVPSMNWGIVAKIDSKEALADVGNLQKLSNAIIAIVSILAGIMSFSVAKSISAPLHNLSEGARKIGGGNLDISVATGARDEIGHLSRTLDKMVVDLKATMASRDELDREIAERRQAEDALRASEGKYRHLFETMTEGIVYQDRDGSIIDMNPAAERILGRSMEEFLGRTSETTENDCVREDGTSFPGSEHPAMVALRSGRTVKNVTMGIYNPIDRMRRWIEITAVPLLRQDEEKPYQVYAVFSDITSRKRFEDALRESELFLNEIQRIARFGGWKVNPAENVLEWSDSIYEIIDAPRGYKPSAATDLQLYLPEYSARLKESVGRCLETGERFVLECQLKTFTGRILWVELRGLKRVVEGKKTYAMGTLQDITERKHAEEGMRRSMEELRAANDELSRFNKVMVDRELRMVEFKRQINELQIMMGQPPQYCVEDRKQDRQADGKD